LSLQGDKEMVDEGQKLWEDMVGLREKLLVKPALLATQEGEKIVEEFHRMQESFEVMHSTLHVLRWPRGLETRWLLPFFLSFFLSLFLAPEASVKDPGSRVKGQGWRVRCQESREGVFPMIEGRFFSLRKRDMSESNAKKVIKAAAN
jgi:hypothetical protein